MKTSNKIINNTVRKLFKEGYCIVDKVLTHKQCESFIEHIEKINKETKKNKHFIDEISDKGQIIIRDLIFRNPKIFLSLIDNKFVMQVLTKIFNDTFIIDNVMASNSNNVEKKYSTLVHMDAHLPTKENRNTTDVIAFFCLDDFTKENGSTIIWPGSHKTGIRIQNSKNYNKLIKKKSISLKTSKGSCVFILGQTWHQIGKNSNSKRRWGIFTHYKRWWIKPSTDFIKCGSKIFKLLNNKQKELLGFTSISPRYDFKKKTRTIRTLRKTQDLNINYLKSLDY